MHNRPILLITHNHRMAESVLLAYGLPRNFFTHVYDPNQLRGLRDGTTVATYLPPDIFIPAWVDEALLIARIRRLHVEHLEDLHTPHKTASAALAERVFDIGMGEGPDATVDRIQCRVDEAEARILTSVGLAAPKIDVAERRTQALQKYYDDHADRIVEQRWLSRGYGVDMTTMRAHHEGHGARADNRVRPTYRPSLHWWEQIYPR